ncbi:hypothetical protein [Streptomyces sp. MAR4 CNX-425]|uniref:hypothetical protein n=1 Tax=Streptomyces sp. MAR4 CNX-425 TaxID=3406343 RepID=UPI003B509D14
MNDDVEEVLGRELNEVASGLQVPARPPLPQEERVQTRGLFRWPRLVGWRPVVVAAVTLAVVGAVSGVLSYLDGGPRQTAVPPPTRSPSVPTDGPSTPTQKPPARPLTADAPTVPYLLEGRLFAGGEQVPGEWLTLRQAGDAWAAWSDDGTWSWGTGPEGNAIPGTVVLQPRLSPDGGLLAVGTITPDGGRVLLIDTRSGETVDSLPFDAAEPGDPNALGVVAVTGDRRVFIEDGSDNGRLWLAGGGDRTVDLDSTAPGQQVRGSTAAGLIVFDETRDGRRDATYLAEASGTGALTRLRTLPSEEAAVNPSGSWLAYGGSWGGESETISEITAQQVDGGRELTLAPADKRQLLPKTWEDDDLLLAELYTDGSPTGLARCSVREEACMVVDLP